MIDTIALKIMSPVAVVWEEQVVSISAENSEGVFDILPDHARFMSLINTKPVRFELPDSSIKMLTFKQALLFFQDNKATIYTHELLQKTD